MDVPHFLNKMYLLLHLFYFSFYKRKTKEAASPLILGSLVLKSKMREAKASPLHLHFL